MTEHQLHHRAGTHADSAGHTDRPELTEVADPTAIELAGPDPEPSKESCRGSAPLSSPWASA